jgi:hypothetical protein
MEDGEALGGRIPIWSGLGNLNVAAACPPEELQGLPGAQRPQREPLHGVRGETPLGELGEEASGGALLAVAHENRHRRAIRQGGGFQDTKPVDQQLDGYFIKVVESIDQKQ